MAMRGNSLALCLVISSAAWTLMILSLTAAILISLCRDFIQENFDERLNHSLENLIAKTAPQGTLKSIAQATWANPSFPNPFRAPTRKCGLRKIEATPHSSQTASQMKPTGRPSDLGIQPDQRMVRQAYVDGPDGQVLRVLERDIDFAEMKATFLDIGCFRHRSRRRRDALPYKHSCAHARPPSGVGLLLATFSRSASA